MATCETCDYFKPNPSSHNGFGTCRVNPPGPGAARWPEVNRYEDFCGSHPLLRAQATTTEKETDHVES